MWITGDSRVAPWDVKKAIGTVAYQFQGFAQQDSFELFNYVVDTLHEDLNRVKVKPYSEVKDSDGRPDDEVSADHWNSFASRNQSVIVDLMYGQLKSRLICNVCKTISNTFDPFLALSLPIPKNKYSKVSITYFPLELTVDSVVKRVKLNLGPSDTVAELKDKLAEQMDTKNKILLFSIKRRNQIDEKIDDDVLAAKLEDEKLVAIEFETPEEPKRNSIVPVTFIKETKSYFGNSNHEDVCEPKVFLHHVDKTCTDLRFAIFKYFFQLIKLPEKYAEDYEKAKDKEKITKLIYESFYVKSDFGEKKIMKFEYEKEKSMYMSQRKFDEFKDSEELFGDYLDKLDSDHSFSIRVFFPKETRVDLDPLEKSNFKASASGAISIDDCLERFRVDELLTDDNKYYCSKCKDHQDTHKKMDLYKLPKILSIQLKRFNKEGGGKKYGVYSMMSGSSKNSDLIDFPITGLDMGKYLLQKEDGKEYLYDLYAVSNHMGSLYGGHYTAHCKNSLTNKWYYFNDSSCGATSESDIVCSSAYVLFYRLRE